MGLRTADEYRESLRDGRVLWYRGKRIDDALSEPDLRVAVDHSAVDFEIGHDPAYRSIAVVDDGDTSEPYSAYYRIPRSTDDLLARMRLIETTTALGGTLISLKDVGTDALFALQTVLQDVERERLMAFYERCRAEDLAVAVAQTDVKGDRSKAPHEQADPDMYLRVVDESDEGIVVRGAKAHTSLTPNCNEILVLPTRAMGPEDTRPGRSTRGSTPSPRSTRCSRR